MIVMSMDWFMFRLLDSERAKGIQMKKKEEMSGMLYINYYDYIITNINYFC